MRHLALACLLAAAALLPVQAEAAKIRYSRSSAATAPKTSRTVIIAPGVGGAARAQAAEADKPARVPFPPPSPRPEEPVQLRLTATEGSAPKPWCRSDAVVGGFCMLN
jgi:hypothetical protein